MRNAKPGHEHALNKLLPRQARELLIEVLDECDLEAELLEERQLARQRRQAKMLLVRLKEFARVRLEHHGAGRSSKLLCFSDSRTQKRAMAQMDAVKIADGNNGRACGDRHMRMAVNDLHGFMASLRGSSGGVSQTITSGGRVP